MAIKKLSDGLKSRVVFSYLAHRKPHMMLLDEPTNHLDIETIDSLARGINAWDGGLVLVSHDFRLIGQVATEIWEVKGGRVTVWPGDISSYKKYLAKQMDAFAGK
jgi:ATP-binding cassette, subfamily F, member 2